MYFLGVIAYMYYDKDHQRNMLPFFTPSILHAQPNTIYLSIIVGIEIVFAILLKQQYLKSINVEEAFRKQRDATKELALTISAKNKDLLIQQEQEIRIATLGERNRIAREIHDNVGHLLSSSLIQLGALQIIAKQQQVSEGLGNLRDTISIAMDSVRSSVHDLHAESLDLELMIKKLIERFTFCEVYFEYDMMHTFKQTVIYHILAIVKECMNNTMKHSNATKLQIVIREQPAFFQIICNDNGVNSKIKDSGIGLQNIQERIDSLHGYVNVTDGEGFKVFVTLPKEDAICEW